MRSRVRWSGPDVPRFLGEWQSALRQVLHGASVASLAAVLVTVTGCGGGGDNSGTSDLAAPTTDIGTADLSIGSDSAAQPDLATGTDSSAIHDLSAIPDLSASADSSTGSDAATPADLAHAGSPDFALVNGKATPATQTTQRYFPDTAPWYRDLTGDKPASDSDAITTWMVGKSPPGGWGNHGVMQVDFSIVAVDVPPGTTKRQGQSVNGFFYSPDCDTAPVPLPPGGAVEETYGVPTVFTSPFSGYNCTNFDDPNNPPDCHMLFVARGEHRLYEIYHGTIDANNLFRTGCLAVWNTSAVDPNGRGQQCTSADAAGFPIAPLLFSVEELAAGKIDHAIRFILPNTMIRTKTYTAPATHGTNTSGPITAGPYGFRMRLKTTFDINTLSPAAQVVARALQKYGMLLADGGQIALTAQSDVLSPIKYSDVGFDSKSLSTLKATDFEVIDDTPTTPVTYDCQRTPITQ